MPLPSITLPWALVLLPWAGAVLLAALPSFRIAALVNIGVSALSFVLALFLFGQPLGEPGWLRLDALNLPLIVLSFLIGLTAAVFSAGAAGVERFGLLRGRLWHAGFQAFIGAQALALLSDNPGLVWGAMGIAAIAGALLVAAHGTVPAIRAAWKLLLLCGIGIALALFGTILLHLAAQPLPVSGGSGLSWAVLRAMAEQCDPGVLNLAFIFLLVGYGTLAGLVPLHSWLPDAEAEGPAAASALLSGLLLNAALHAVLRAKAILGAHPGAVAPGPFLVAFGLASVLLAALALWRRGDVRRFFAWSSIGQIGLAAIAFGLGGAAANLAGLLQMLGHSLCKGAVVFGIGYVAQAKVGQGKPEAGGLCASHPALGWALVIAIAALIGLPPFALFASEFLLLTELAARNWWLLVPLGLGMLAAVAAMVTVLQDLCLGDPGAEAPRRRAARSEPGRWPQWNPAEAAVLGPLWLHLALALILGVTLPGPLAALLAEAARIPG